MANIKIIYASIGGNTELACQMCKKELELKGNIVSLERSENVEINQDLNNNDLIILASPTYGQGDLEKQMKDFLKAYKKLDNKTQKYAVIGLGDTKFYPEYLSESASLLEEWLAKNASPVIVPSLRIGMPPLKYLDKLVPRFCTKIDEALK